MSLSNFLLTLKGGPNSGNHGHSGRPGKRGGSSPSHFQGLETTTILGVVVPKSKTPVEVYVFDEDEFIPKARKVLNDKLFGLSASTPGVYVPQSDKGFILLKKDYGDDKRTILEEYGHHLDSEAGQGKSSWGGHLSHTGAFDKFHEAAIASGEVKNDYQRYNRTEFAADAFVKYSMSSDPKKFSEEMPNHYQAYLLLTAHLRD